jgi:hypothetical protein
MRVIKAATDLSRDVHRADSWFRNKALSAFAFKTADQLACEGRTDDVLQYLAFPNRRALMTALAEEAG